MVDKVIVAVITTIAQQVTKEVSVRLKNKNPTEIDVEKFQKSIELTLNQTLEQYANTVYTRMSNNESRIIFLENALAALSNTVSDINNHVGYDVPERKNRLVLAALEPSITKVEIEELAIQNTQDIFSNSFDSKSKLGIASFAINAKGRTDAWLTNIRGEKYDEK